MLGDSWWVIGPGEDSKDWQRVAFWDSLIIPYCVIPYNHCWTLPQIIPLVKISGSSSKDIKSRLNPESSRPVTSDLFCDLKHCQPCNGQTQVDCLGFFFRIHCLPDHSIQPLGHLNTSHHRQYTHSASSSVNLFDALEPIHSLLWHRNQPTLWQNATYFQGTQEGNLIKRRTV